MYESTLREHITFTFCVTFLLIFFAIQIGFNVYPKKENVNENYMQSITAIKQLLNSNSHTKLTYVRTVNRVLQVYLFSFK